MKAGVYKIRHRVSNRVYIGSSKDAFTRMRKHREQLNRREHGNPSLQNAWNKYGENAFEFSVLLICSKKDLIFYEQKAIDAYRATEKSYGYNMRKIAQSNLGMTFDRGTHKRGQKFGRLTLIDRYDKEANGKKWRCLCSCGKITIVNIYAVRMGYISSCGCLKKEVLRKLKRHTHNAGEKYNRLTFISPKEKGCADSTEWLMRCDCGIEKFLVASRVARGKVESCGCLTKEVGGARLRTHGLSHTKEHLAWQNMKSRCYKLGNISYWAVGARGIKVCDRWMKFESFYKDMGKCPDGKSLQRIDNNGNFEPSNCKWATRTEQMKNNRHATFVLVDGKKMNVSDAEKLIGIYRSSINQRTRQTGETYQQATDHFVAKYRKSA